MYDFADHAIANNRALVDRLHETVIPGRREAASPESSKPPPLVTGFRALGPSGLDPE